MKHPFEWGGNPRRILDLVTADEAWIREVMQESDVGWPRVDEVDATEEVGTVE